MGLASLAAFWKSSCLLNSVLSHPPQGCLSLFNSVEGIITVWERRVGSRHKVLCWSGSDLAKYVIQQSLYSLHFPFSFLVLCPCLIITSTTQMLLLSKGNDRWLWIHLMGYPPWLYSLQQLPPTSQEDMCFKAMKLRGWQLTHDDLGRRGIFG